MPICYKIDNENFSLGLWEISEDENQLISEFSTIAPKKEIAKAEKFKYPSRKSEWIATRLLMYNLINKVISIDYNENGKPIIDNHNHCISISHTKGMVAVIIAKNLAGIDIEQFSDRVEKVENKFMSGIERIQISKKNKTSNLLAYWSAKETLYKIYGGKGLDFKKNLYINPFELSARGEFTGEIITQNQSVGYRLNYFNYVPRMVNNNYLIVYYYN
ncbi:MAG: 4'-phosphopantetheinyl transferase superfamily protein [Bacteroidales bacterium]|nr:4'-phosphopantetheinyl transferase superfamily protein [Bacteroidales bacterium]